MQENSGLTKVSGKPPLDRLCLGGSFNPVHHGHLICARAAAEAVGVEMVTLVPTAMPPHKPAMGIAEAAHRLAMCRLAIDGVMGFEVDEREIQRGGASYTIETVREMKADGMGRVGWIIGSDMLNYLPKWREASALVEEVVFVVMARPGVGFKWSSLPVEFQKLKGNVVEVPQVEISSTTIRERVSRGEGIEYLTPAGVCRYIAERGLYRE